MLSFFMAYSSTLKIDVTCCGKMRVDFEWITWCYIPEQFMLYMTFFKLVSFLMSLAFLRLHKSQFIYHFYKLSPLHCHQNSYLLSHIHCLDFHICCQHSRLLVCSPFVHTRCMVDFKSFDCDLVLICYRSSSILALFIVLVVSDHGPLRRTIQKTFIWNDLKKLIC